MKRHHVNRIFALSIIVSVLLVVGFWIYQTEAKNEPRVVEVEIGGDNEAKGEGVIGPNAIIVPDDAIITGRLGVKAGTQDFQMAVLDSGVGIGTLSPAGKLDVIGNIITDGLALSRDNVNRGAIWFANAHDINVSMFNNISDIDGEGAWDGIKMYFVQGFDIGYRGGDGRVSVMFANRSGNVGIGTTNPQAKLHVIGNALADAHTTPSSKRWKTNIKPIEGALSKVQRLRGVEYDWKADGKHDIGLIAEEVGEVIPEIVVYEENGVDAKSVAYARLVAVLIEAVKEQQKIIDAQNSELTEMKSEMAQFSSTLQRLEALVAVGKSVNGNAIQTQGE